MRLHRLELTAFGPFAGTEVVDVDALAAGGLFLLHGPTGAGKTSVLDAVCFALYGQVPGARGGSRARLRSDHAPDDREPRVRLELTVGGRRIEVTRSPEWSRPKKRGTGFTRQPASTHVRELVGGEWVPLTTRNDEAGQLLLDLMGMGHEQFTKVVLLPQGDFAAFLRADAEQRRELLSRLFSIDRFTGVEVALADERRRLGADVEATRQRGSALLARAGEAFAGLPATDDGPLAGDGPDADDPEQKVSRRVAALLERATSLARAAQVVVEAQTERATTAHGALAEATTLVTRRRRFVTATSRLAELDATAGPRDEAACRVDLARRGAPATALLDGVAVADAALRAAAERVDATRARTPVEHRSFDEREVRRQLAAHRTLLGSLDTALERGTEHRQLTDRARELRAQRDTAAARCAAAATRRGAADVTLVQARAAERAAALRAADLDAAAAAHVAALAIGALVVDLAACERDLAVAGSAARDAVDADQAARERQLDLWQQRVADLAGELAAGLRPGAPCQVCGSHEHPAPAALGADHVGRAAVDEATRVAEAARGGRVRAERLVADLTARRSELVSRTGGTDAAAAGVSLAAAAHRLEAARAAQREVATQSAAATAAATELDDASAEQRRWGDAEVTAATALREVTAAAELLAVDLERARGEDPDVTTRCARLAGEVEALDALLDALTGARTAQHLADDQRERLAAAAARLGFDDPAEVAAAVLPEAVVAQLAAVVLEHDAQRRAHDAVLAEPELAGLEGSCDPDLVALQAAVGMADRDLQRATSRATLASDGERRLARLVREATEHEDASAPLLQAYDRVDQLAACVQGTGGDNALRMRLSAYVLAARLEEVAAAATERWQVMSGGRYALVHSDERGKGGGRSGLGLRVVDAWTGHERDTATLSGGEAFVASLALALGLADVVQAEAGGTTIATLFVDEGFGTLDDDTLEEVMTVLDGLRDGGRVVGLVSHVADLRGRIPHQLQVRKTRSGSTLAASLPGGAAS